MDTLRTVPNVIVLGGPGGSGRSTLAQKLVEITSYNHIYGGAMQRALSVEAGYGERDSKTQQLTFSEAAFIKYHQEYVPHHPEIDLKIDVKLFEAAHRGKVIIESMTFGPLAKRVGFEALKIWITADEETRVQRLMQREQDGGRTVSADVMIDLLRKRTDANKKRYQALYGFDYLHVGEYYDFTFDTTHIPPESMAERLFELIQKRTQL
ncbi:AAA family ATPase [candidate division WWE3 bacterium]|nr:AAA family ATPase [candidate division WWE3 bacterium]